MIALVILAFLLLPFNLASAATYYVAFATGLDSNSGTSTATPWKTITKVNAQKFVPGDSILFNRGDTWPGPQLLVPTSGASGNPITFGAYGTGAIPKIDGLGGSVPGGLFVIRGKSWITVDSLEITNMTAEIVSVISDGIATQGIVFRNCHVHRNTVAANMFNFANWTWGSNFPSHPEGLLSNITVENCTISDSGHNTLLFNGGITNVTIRNNTIFNFGHNGIDIKGAQTASSRNRNFTIVGNHIHTSTSSPGVGIFAADTANALIDSNVIHGTSDSGIKSHHWQDNSVCSGCPTIPNVGPNIYQRNIVYNTVIAFHLTQQISPTMYNNSVTGTTSTALLSGVEPGGVLTRTNDLAFGNPGGNTTFTNPTWANSAAGDFRLCTAVNVPVAGCAGASFAINAGTNVGLPFSGSAPDLGALETATLTRWVSSSGGTIGATCTGANVSATKPTGTNFQTLAQGLACLVAGDTLMLAIGDYGALSEITNVPSGTIIRSEQAAGDVRVGWIGLYTRNNIQFIGSVFGGVRNFKVDAAFINTGTHGGTAVNMSNVQNIRFENVEVTQGYDGGIFFGGSGNSGIDFINVKSHNNGNGSHSGVTPGGTEVCLGSNPWPQSGPGGSDPGKCHGIYADQGANITVDGGEYSNNNGTGIQICSQATSNVVVKNTVARNNVNIGIAFCQTTNGQAFNNVVTNNAGGGIYIYESLVKAYSNTAYLNGTLGISSRTNTAGQEVKNNLSISNSNPNIGCSAPCTSTNNITTGTAASHFANAANGDFRLCTGAGTPGPLCTAPSTAINAGGALGSPWNVDIVGTSRPQGTGYSAGAYEETGTVLPPLSIQFALKLACDGNVNDTSGNGNHGTLVGGTTTSATGKYNQACSFDPALSQHIQINDSNSLDMTTAFTLAAWVLVPGPQSALRYIIAKENIAQGLDGSYYLAGSSTGTCGSGGNFGGYIQGATAVLACHSVILPSTPAWTHLAVTYNAQSNPQVALYKNGTIVNTNVGGAAVLTPGTGNLFIGSGNGDGYFSGLIDEVWIFQGAIPATGAFDSNCTTNASDPNSWSINRVMNCSINPVTPTPGAPTGVKVGGAGTVKIGGGGIVRMGQ